MGEAGRSSQSFNSSEVKTRSVKCRGVLSVLLCYYSDKTVRTYPIIIIIIIIILNLLSPISN